MTIFDAGRTCKMPILNVGVSCIAAMSNENVSCTELMENIDASGAINSRLTLRGLSGGEIPLLCLARTVAQQI